MIGRFAFLAVALSACTAAPSAQANQPGSCVIEIGPSAERAGALADCDFAMRRVAMILGPSVTPVVVHLVDQPGYRADYVDGTIIFSAPTAASRARSDTAFGRAGRAGEPLLEQGDFSHELAHALLAVWYGFDGASRERSEYATPLPDWFDEAVAIWAETDGEREHRLSRARRHASPSLDLPGLLVMIHPNLEWPHDPNGPVSISSSIREPMICQVAACAALPQERDTSVIVRKEYAGGRITVDTVPPSSYIAHLEAVNRFYELSGALLPFIQERGGREAIRELADRMRRDAPVEGVLDRLPGLPPDRTRFEAALAAWLADRPASGSNF